MAYPLRYPEGKRNRDTGPSNGEQGEKQMANMTEGRKEKALSGYGSSYHKGGEKDLKDKAAIGAVLGGQVWLVKPDKTPRTDNPCIWMQAGVAEFKNCNNYYDCTTCRYDMGMKKNVKKGARVSWQDAMRMRPGMDRVCRHSLTNRIERRVCAYDYQCATCDFDQFFEEVWSPRTATAPYETHHVKGFEIPTGYYFHNGHTWARIESGGAIRVGMDDFSGKLLGTPDALDLPLTGKELNSNKVGWGMRRRDNTADFLSPVGGVITEVNGALREQPAMGKGEPYERGWLFMVHTPDIKGSVRKLMADAESLQWMDGEVGRLEVMIEDVAGPLAADGGHLTDDIFGSLPGLGWSNLTRTFLKSE
jgi:glycine cleavage system H lipoate-binding protein